MLLKDKGKNTNLSLTSQLTLFTARYCIQGNIRPHFIFAAPFTLLSAGKYFRNGRIPLSQTIFLYSQHCPSEFKDRAKMFASEKGQKYHEAKTTLYTVTLHQYLMAYFSKIIMH